MRTLEVRQGFSVRGLGAMVAVVAAAFVVLVVGFHSASVDATSDARR